ncbi:MAG TPA: aspartyl protease family protein [Bryobacteraceae bacterium]
MLRPLLLLCLLAGSIFRPASAQENDLLPPDRYLTSVHFSTLNGGIILGKVKLNSYPDSLNFIFDTGCGGASLDSTTAARFQLHPREASGIVRGIAGKCQQRVLDSVRLTIGNLVIDSLRLHVNDYDILSSIYGEKIDGILGYSFFSRYLVRVDYDSSRLDVFTKGPIHYPGGGFLLRPRVFGLPMLEGRLADTRPINGRFYFDTGAGLCLLFSSNFSEDSAVFSPKRKKLRTQGAGLGGKTDMQLTTLRTFSLGPFHFRQIPTYIFDDSFDVTSYPQLGGLIGNDLLRRFNLIINYPHSEIYILPNGNYNQPFDYSYSGVFIALIEGKVIVTDVMEGSPGERAGLKEGDVILQVNGDKQQNLQVYQNLLRTIGPKVKVLVRHADGEMTLCSLKVASIL